MRSDAQLVKEFVVALLPDPKIDIGYLSKAIALVEPLCARIVAIDGQLHGIARLLPRESQAPVHQRCADAFLEAYLLAGDPPVRTMIEATAGQGTNLGYRFEHLRDLLERVWDPDWFAVCIDTCHIFAAGYDWSTPEGYAQIFADFDEIVVLDQLAWFHLNDSKKALASRVDRHAEIGQGEIGLEPFRWLVNDERFASLPAVLETPNNRMRENLEVLRSLVS